MINTELIILFIASYFIGGTPVGVLIARARGVDIMSVGSKNVGATNVLRILGKKWGFLVFFLDVAKGVIPALLAQTVSPHQEMWLLAGLLAVVGHCLSPFLKFRGGKGVATALGMLIGSAPLVAASSFGLFILLLSTTRYMSLSAIIAVTSSIFFGWLYATQAGYSYNLLPAYILMTAFIVYRHRANIKRLAQGTEPKFSFSMSEKQAQESPATTETNAEAEETTAEEPVHKSEVR